MKDAIRDKRMEETKAATGRCAKGVARAYMGVSTRRGAGVVKSSVQPDSGAQLATQSPDKETQTVVEGFRQWSESIISNVKSVLKYKGYLGSVEFDADDRIFHGRVLGISDMVGFEGTSVDELEEGFRNAVDDYLESCDEFGKEPEKPFSGQFRLRIPSRLHCAIALEARRQNQSINAWITEVLERTIEAQ